MNNSSLSFEEKMLLAYYGELSAQEQQEFERSIEANSALAAQYHHLCATLNGVKDVPPQEPSEDFWTALEYNIHAAVRRETPVQKTVKEAEQKIMWWQSLKELFLTPQRIGFTLAGGLACTIMGMFIGWKMTPVPQQQNLAAADTTTPTVAASSEQVTNFLKRSQIYFATSLDEEVKCAKCVPIKQQLDNKKIAEDLLREASKLKAQLQEQTDTDHKTKKLLTDIEFVLSNISSNPAINPAQAEVVHHIASNAVCEVATKIDSTHGTIPQQHK